MEKSIMIAAVVLTAGMMQAASINWVIEALSLTIPGSSASLSRRQEITYSFFLGLIS
jgi:hypothetical protein